MIEFYKLLLLSTCAHIPSMQLAPRKFKETFFNVLKDNPGKVIMSKESMDIFYSNKEYEWVING